MPALEALLALLAPPRCACCCGSCGLGNQLCTACLARLEATRSPPRPFLPSLDSAWTAFPYEGAARELVVALKFRSLLPVAGLIAELIAERAPREVLAGTLVPVPAASSRMRRRGFDPAEEIAERLMAVSGQPFAACLDRADGPRQVGRRRAARLADPPRVRAIAPAPPIVVLVDDVQTTGATLSACARALRLAGAERVSAVTFARTM